MSFWNIPRFVVIVDGRAGPSLSMGVEMRLRAVRSWARRRLATGRSGEPFLPGLPVTTVSIRSHEKRAG
jgi:hypothetical protein